MRGCRQRALVLRVRIAKSMNYQSVVRPSWKSPATMLTVFGGLLLDVAVSTRSVVSTEEAVRTMNKWSTNRPCRPCRPPVLTRFKAP